MTRSPMLRKLRLVLVLLLLGAAGYVVWRFGRHGAATAATNGETAIWATGDAVAVTPTTEPATSAWWDGATIHLAGARNEVIAWQIVCRPATAVSGSAVIPSALSGEGGAAIPAERISVFREHLLTVTVPSQMSGDEPVAHGGGPGDYPNQLLPLGADGFDAPAGVATALWFDLHIPEKAQPGLYRGRVELSGGGLAEQIPVELTVWDVRLPRETHFRNYFYYGPEYLSEFYGVEGGELEAIERQYHKLAHDHRVSLATEPDVGPRFDWGAWWARYGGYLDGSAFTAGPCARVGANLWPVAITCIDDKTEFQAACRDVVRFFESKKLLDRVFLGLGDEPGDAEAYERIRRLGSWAHEATGKKLRTMVTEQVQPEQPAWGTLLGSVDIFCSARSSDADMAFARARGADIWVYNGGLAGGPYIDCPPLGVTAWGPAAWRWQLGGWYFWNGLYWRQRHFRIDTPTDLYRDPLTFDEAKRKRSDGSMYPEAWAMRLNGDGVMLYPGEPAGVAGPVACIRLKAFRRGAQDYEYLWLLAKAGHREQADAFARRLSTGRGEWEPNPDVWQATRAEIAALLAGGT